MMTKRVISILLAVVLIVFAPIEVLAVGWIDRNREVSLEILYQDDKTPLVGAYFAIYRIGAVDQYGNLTPTLPFARYHIDYSNRTEEQWRIIAATLEGYILRDHILPTDCGITDAESRLSFPNHAKRLEQGLYLVMGNRHEQGEYVYEMQPFLVMLPTLDQVQDEWSYDVTVKPKTERILIEEEEEETVKRKVLKVWADEGHEQERPGEILVDLLRDGEVHDTVILNEENNWSHTWESLEAGHRWVVAEQTPAGYSVTVNRVGITYVITNTYEEQETTPTEPSAPTEPSEPTVPTGPGEDTVPTESTQPSEETTQTEPSEPSGSTEPTNPNLPQTGQLWWPVPVLMAAGLFLIVLGLLRRREERYEG